MSFGYERRLERAKARDALIFPEHHRDAFRELLEEAKLRRDPNMDALSAVPRRKKKSGSKQDD